MRHRPHNRGHKKQVLASRNGGARCAYCGQRMKLRKLTLDHVVPLSLGGSNALENLVLACGPCNGAKGTLSVEEFMAVAS